MKRVLGWLIVGVLALAHGAYASPLSKQEREQLIQHLKKSEKMLKEATKGLSAEQWKFKPAPDKWSVQDCVEHLTLAEEFGLQFMEDILKSPPGKVSSADPAFYQANVDRSRKMQAPEQIRPTGQWQDPKELLKEFSARRKKTIEHVKTTQDDLRGHVLGGFDGYQAVLAAAAHTERHVAQMLEVKADPSFPKT
jgi:hypothetical protein